MATEDNFIVAIELGSSKVTAIAGRKQPDGAIQVLAFAQERSSSFIRKGRINNISKMTQCISGMKEKLEKKLQKTISRAYVGIGGMGMHTVGNTVTRHFPAKTIVEQDVIDSILAENLDAQSGERVILDTVPQEFKLGTQVTNEPVGISAESIEGHYLNVLANASVGEDIRNCFRNAGIGIAGMPITVQVLADIILTEPEKRSGCVFVDMGSETTSVLVYKNNILRHLAVIPLGGANINRDISSLQIEDDEAETLKIKYGSALRNEDEAESSPIFLQDGRQVKFEEFSGLVEARMEEIILNVNNQISLSNYDKSQLIGGLVVTGGAANIKDIEKAFERYTGFEKLRFVKNVRLQLRTSGKELADFNADGSCNAAISIIDKAELNCCGGDLGSSTPDIFLEEEERKKREEAERLAREKREQEEREAREREEAERLAREEEERRRKERRFKGIKKMFGKVSDMARKMVTDDEGPYTSEEKKDSEK